MRPRGRELRAAQRMAMQARIGRPSRAPQLTPAPRLRRETESRCGFVLLSKHAVNQLPPISVGGHRSWTLPGTKSKRLAGGSACPTLEGCAPASRDRCPRCEDSGSEVFFRAPSCIGERRRRLEAQRTEASDQVLPFDWSNGRHSSDFADLNALAVNVRNRGVIEIGRASSWQ